MDLWTYWAVTVESEAARASNVVAEYIFYVASCDLVRERKWRRGIDLRTRIRDLSRSRIECALR